MEYIVRVLAADGTTLFEDQIELPDATGDWGDVKAALQTASADLEV